MDRWLRGMGAPGINAYWSFISSAKNLRTQHQIYMNTSRDRSTRLSAFILMQMTLPMDIPDTNFVGKWIVGLGEWVLLESTLIGALFHQTTFSIGSSTISPTAAMPLSCGT